MRLDTTVAPESMWNPLVNNAHGDDSVAVAKLVGFCLPLVCKKSTSIPTVLDTPK